MVSIAIGSRDCIFGIVLAVSGLCQTLSGQTISPAHPAEQQSPSYEVATIKPAKDGEDFT
jgi:hypothetical protein